MSYRICLLPGDGIGPEVIAQAEKVLKALDLQFEFELGDIGFGAYQKHGTPLPDSTLESIRKSDATLFGAVTTPPIFPVIFHRSCACARHWTCMPTYVPAVRFTIPPRAPASTW